MTKPLEPTDAEYQAAILNAAGPQELVAAIWAYYHGDRDRADRAPRELLYLHIGMLAGAVMRALDPGRSA